MTDHAFLLICALLLDAALGEPRWLWDRAPHPAVLMGWLIDWCDRRFNNGDLRRAHGLYVIVALGGLAMALGWIVASLPLGWVFETVVAAILLAQKSLVDHVRAVADGLRQSLDAGRRDVRMLVGRDTADLDESAIARAAIESAAENLSDGVVAPAFWFLIGGLPGILLYKITNTADSMIGHRTERHEEFGWAAARLDDGLNWVPARLTAAFIALVSGVPGAWQAARREGPLHRSVNAGWPEAAMARALDLALSGPRSYGGQMTDDPILNPTGRRAATSEDIETACKILWRVWAAMVGSVVLLALLTRLAG